MTYEELLIQPGKLQALKSDPKFSFEERWGMSESNLPFSAYSSANVISTLFSDRILLVANGIKYCFPEDRNICNPNDPKAQLLNTKDFDQGFKLIFSDFEKKLSNPLLSPEVAQNINYDLSASSYNFGITCDGNAFCPESYFLRNPDGSSRVDHWTSTALDSLKTRWGF